jgi:hypothetical protein
LLNNPEQAFFDIPISGTRCSHGGNETFPGWGQNIPKLGNRLAASLVEESFCAFIGDINGVGLHYLQRFYCKSLHLSTNLSKPA